MDFCDHLETRPPEAREATLFAALPGHLAHARRTCPAFARLLDGVAIETVTDRAALARLPVVRKADLIERQRAEPPFGGLASTVGLVRVFQSPGPIYDPEGGGSDWWKSARPLFAAGFRPGDLVHNCFSYHFTPAGVMFETGAHALGCTVFPGGVGNTELQARAIADLRPDGYVGTPSFLKIILEKARELALDHSSLTKALVTGEALPTALRDALASFGVTARQCYGTADLGIVAYETAARQGMVVNEDVIVEIVRPGTGDPLPDGEVGEVVVTVLRAEYPLIRFATGDLSAVLPGLSPCGRTNQRITGWMGRADQSTKVKGMFIHPPQVAEVARRHGLTRFRLEVASVDGADAMVLHAETERGDDSLTAALRETLQAVCKLRGDVRFHPPGTLPNDGKVIDDKR